MQLGRRIAQARHEAGLATAEQLAGLIGKSVHTVYAYEAGNIVPPIPVLEKIAKATGRPLQWFLSGEDSALGDMLDRTEKELQRIRQDLAQKEAPPGPGTIRFPLLGTVPAGNWAEAIERTDEYEDLPAAWLPPGMEPPRCIALRVKGDSMVGCGVAPGSVVIVCREVSIKQGDVVIARYQGEVTIKRYMETTAGPVLLAENPAYPPLQINDGTEIVGKVVLAVQRF